MLRIECITDDDFTGSIRSALLKMVSVGDLVVIMTARAGFSGTVRRFTFEGKRVSVTSLKNDLLVKGILGYDCGRIKKKEEQRH
jgi:hypothetical protein